MTPLSHIRQLQVNQQGSSQLFSKQLPQAAKNVSTKQKSMSAVLCKSCKRLLALLEHQKQRSDVSPERRIARQQPSSSFKLKYQLVP